ncbi:MAG: Cof-type HAD-IIB family hydrolase [Solobacterium sp.]|nr:Cof-type HAD-IIB family hydrolase [Solobacterium sp.]
MIKAIFFDIDGTLISMKTKKISPLLIDALYQLKEKGILLFIATGRPPVQLPHLGETFNAFPWDGYVMMNGQYCMDSERQCFYKLPLSRSTLESLIPYLQQADFPCTVMEEDFQYEIRFNPKRYEYLKSLNRENEYPEPIDPRRAFEHETFQYSPYIPEEMDEEFVSHAPGIKSARWSPDFADMIPVEGGKPEGMKRMLERHHLTLQECMACGDGGNDITMIRAAGIGVAMGNGREEVKKAADYVTLTCEEDGLVHAFRHFNLL